MKNKKELQNENKIYLNNAMFIYHRKKIKRKGIKKNFHLLQKVIVMFQIH